MKKAITYLAIIFGGAFVVIFTDAEEKQNVLLLVLGMLVLMFGLFRLNKSIPSKTKKNINYFTGEEEEEEEE